MFGIDDAALIGLAGSLASGAMNLAGQSQQAGQQGSALRQAMQNYMQQERQADRQYELSTAGSTNARGDSTVYIPGRGWVVNLSPRSQALLNQGDAVQRQQGVEAITRGPRERETAALRRGEEGAAASSLLDAMTRGYGAPTKEGATGANTIANVTGASEAADNIKSAITAAALRTGTGTMQAQQSVQDADRGALTGVRSALARGAAEGPGIYQQMLDTFNAGKLNPYNTLATRASNIENTPFSADNINVDPSQRASYAGASYRGGGTGQTAALTPLMTAMLSQRQPNYDTFVAGLTDNLKNIFGGSKKPAFDPESDYSGFGYGRDYRGPRGPGEPRY